MSLAWIHVLVSCWWMRRILLNRLLAPLSMVDPEDDFVLGNLVLQRSQVMLLYLLLALQPCPLFQGATHAGVTAARVVTIFELLMHQVRNLKWFLNGLNLLAQMFHRGLGYTLLYVYLFHGILDL